MLAPASLDLKCVPKMGTFVPVMGTKHGSLAATLFGKTRQAVLGLLYSHPDQAFYLRQITQAVDLGQGTVQRELAQLVEAGLLTKKQQGNQIHFQANPVSPIYAELRAIVTKTVGAADALRRGLTSLAPKIKVAFIYGSVAEGKERSESDIDLMVIGDVSLGDVVEALQSAEKAVGREVNPSVYPPAEYRKKIHAKHHFLTSLVDAPKIFLIGGPDELRSLA